MPRYLTSPIAMFSALLTEKWPHTLARAVQSGRSFVRMALTACAGNEVARQVKPVATPLSARFQGAQLVVHDAVNAAKIANERAHIAEKRFNDLDSLSDGFFWEADAISFDATMVSQNITRILGYPQKDWLQPGFWANRIHPEDREQTVAFFAGQVLREEPFALEYRFLRSDGQTAWLRDKVSVLVGEARLRGLTIDITEQKQLHRVHSDSENRWKFALDGSDDGLWDWNVSEGTVLYSARWKSMLGYDDAEIGNGIEEWRKRIHPDDLAVTMGDPQVSLGGLTSHSTGDFRMQCKDGSWKWIHARRLVVERDSVGTPIRIIGTHTDIAALRSRDEALLTSSLALDNVSQGVLVTDAKRRIVSANIAFCKITGYDEREILGLDCNFLQGPLTDPKVVLAISQAVRAGERFCGEILNYRKDGDTFWNDLTISAVRNAEGVVVQYVGITRDVTAHKLALQRQAALEEQLRASQKLAAMGKLAGGIAHDFNGILSVIQANAELASLDMIDNPSAVQSLEAINTATARGCDLVRQILTHSRRQPKGLAEISPAPAVFVAFAPLALTTLRSPPTV